ncbi:AAA family ATPase [Spirosoma pollinicola]|uniref:Chromosome segregation protein SMC n=1 Tax=Spirosoma pollinicola TaxID=2057025 RepID=A0A2K8YSX6_9BACT|nr:AAA family ATPase [Spirosoma pollinicola]AUD00731.1 chromosome segregation protein SMC [Spirosoma pollinicola]
MKIKRLVIENFKSIERIELIEPNPFTVFVGPNGSGKSNIFEALEFVNIDYVSDRAINLFGVDKIRRRVAMADSFSFSCDLEEFIVVKSHISQRTGIKIEENSELLYEPDIRRKVVKYFAEYQQYINGFSRIFIRNEKLLKQPFKDDSRLALDASNLEPVLKRILTEDVLRSEIFEWLELFVPGFKAVEIDDRDELHWFEEFSPEYFTKDLISDGTYNILALLTAVYQSDDRPQFLCIEEPENGLHPQVAAELIDFFRIMCEERGHHIWLNTHSQSMIARLKPEEIVIVDKKQGATRIKQISKDDFKNWRMDEALLMNAFGGGLPW